MRSIVIAAGLALSAAVWAQMPAQKTKPAAKTKKAPTKASTAKAAPPKATSHTTTGKKAPVGKKPTASKRPSSKQASSKQVAAGYRRSVQKEPTPDRYKEIQQSLAEKGYFGGPVNGAWGPDSVDALKRFQRDQNIGDDGKLGSLSLMALGLGPKRGSSGPEKPENPGAGLPPP